MPNYIRWQADGGMYFFTIVTYGRRKILTSPIARSLLRHAFTTIRRKLPFEMPVIVLLPDHLHCIWSLPDHDDRFPRRWRQIKEIFTRKYIGETQNDLTITDHQKAEGRRGVWQPRYWEHRICNEREYLAYRDYIHLNPVKHGYVDEPTQWAWSSIHRHLRMGWLEPEWTGSPNVSLPFVGE